MMRTDSLHSLPVSRSDLNSEQRGVRCTTSQSIGGKIERIEVGCNPNGSNALYIELGSTRIEFLEFCETEHFLYWGSLRISKPDRVAGNGEYLVYRWMVAM